MSKKSESVTLFKCDHCQKYRQMSWLVIFRGGGPICTKCFHGTVPKKTKGEVNDRRRKKKNNRK